MGWGGKRPGSGPRKNRPALRAEPKLAKPVPTLPAEPAVKTNLPAIDPRAWAAMLPEIEEISKRYARNKAREPANNPFRLPTFPKGVEPAPNLTMAQDSALMSANGFASNAWLAGEMIDGLPGEGLLFMGFPYLSELAQRPEYRVMSETIADDATRRWIDFDVVGDDTKLEEERAKDPKGFDERMADPDQKKKRVKQAGKSDKVKALQDDQLRLEVRHRFYEQARNDGFFGRSHMFLDIWTTGAEPQPQEMATPIGDGRDDLSKAKVPKGSFKAIRTIEPVWTYPLAYNAINPLKGDWYNPQTWYVMGQQIHISRLPTFIGHPVPDMLKPAYSFGGLSLSQMAKPYVDIWLTTRQSIADLIHSFSVMVLMTDLSTMMQPGNVAPLLARVAMFNMLRDNQGTFVVNKNTEDFKNVSAQLGGLHELQAQAQEHMASVSRIPLVKFTGIQPAGLNASSEGEIEVYDDTIAAYQQRFFAPNLTRVVNFEQLSLWGEIDPEITWRFQELRVMTEAEKGQQRKDDADTRQKYVDMGAFSPEEIRKIAIDDPELPFTDLNPEDVPEPPAEEGLVGQGGEGGGEGDNDNEGGGANDAALPFGAPDRLIYDAALDAEWREEDHPRGEGGQFGSGGGGSTISAKTGGEGIPDFLKREPPGASGGHQRLRMPQFGLSPVPWESHQAGSLWQPKARAPMPKSEGKPGAAGSIIAFAPGAEHGVKKLNGVALTPYDPPADWAGVEGTAEIAEPPLPKLPDGMTMSTGVVIREKDGRVWLMRPSKGFGGYDQTFPKGGLEDGLTPQENAIKEAYEETGLKVKITGFAGDHEGDTTVSRFYFAEREGGDPAKAGWEAEGVILAPPDKLDGMLNRKRDKVIAAGLSPAAQPELDPAELKQEGGKLGSNEGGTFTDKAGNKFYIKRPETKAHVANELAASRLYKLAGVGTLDYRPVKGGNHVATAWEQLDKNNVSKMSAAERKEAAKDFAVHAWLSNWDAAGTGGDNQGVRGGKPVTLDVGGSLRYRAQGTPKGAAFGDKVTEVDTMRDPGKSHDAAKLFGKMSESDLKSSVERVTSIPDAAIRGAVGSDAGLADTLIARKQDLAKRFGTQAADEANFQESQHPRDPDGKFASGGGGSSAPSPIKAPEAGKPSAFGGLYKHQGKGDAKADYATTVGFYLNQPAKAGTHYRNLLKNLIENAGHFGLSTELTAKLKGHLGQAWANAGKQIVEKMKGMTDQAELKAAASDAEKAYKKAGALGWKPEHGAQAYAEQITKPKNLGEMGGQKAPPLAPPPAKAKHGPATAAELEKAKKTVALQLQYVPGAPQTPAAQALVDKFNAKWSGLSGLNAASLQQKVDDFKDLTASMAPLQSEGQKAQAAAIAKQKETAQAAAKAEAAKIAAEMNDPAVKEHYDVLKGIGVGGSSAKNAWKETEQTIKTHGLKITPQQGAYIVAYRGSHYGPVNKQLRSGAGVTVEQWKYAAQLDDALDKMPSYKGTVMRGADLTPEQFARYKNAVGKVLQEPGFQSYGVKEKLWGSYNFVTESKSARDIRAFNPHEGGGEVVFKNNTAFFVDKVEGKTVYMKEV